ncbi:MAG: alpha/beta hydrolase [candidate division Zixibacteria bacterium]|nr:alpha/beta hydrolase [candidate division Zixibacteria bacterium]
MLYAVLGIIASVYILILFYVYFQQDKMVFYPTSEIEATPIQSGLEYEDVFIETEDGVKLHAWYIPVESPAATMIFCHGNGGNISHRIESIEQFHALNISVFIFDYRGYGRSEGELSEEGTYKDADAAWEYLTNTREIPANSIISFGRSLGGGIASWLADNREVKALILESTFTSIPDVAAKHYPFLPVKLLSRYHYNSLERVKRLTLPKLFIHSKTDDLIPYSLGEKLYREAIEPKKFIEISGGHNYGYLNSHNMYMREISAFLNSLNPEK